MRLLDFRAKTPLIGMILVFVAMGLVVLTDYVAPGWYSIIGYVIAAGVAVFGFVFTFRDIPTPPPDADVDEIQKPGVTPER